MTDDSAGRFRVERVEVATLRPLRHEVLREGLPAEAAVFEGDDDPLAAHFAAFESARVVSVGSIMPDSPPWDPESEGAWRIRGMATLAALRGLGLGRRVLDALLGHAARHGGQVAWCHARIGALDFYRRAGFDTTGEVFDDGVAIHQSMWRELDTLSSGR